MPRRTLRLARRWAAPLALAVAGLAATGSALAIGDPKAARFYEDALTRFEKQDVTGAIIQLKNALQIDKNLLQVHVLLGRALLANGEAVAAEVSFNEAMRLGVNRAEVVVPLAQAVLAQGKPLDVLTKPVFAPAGLPNDVQAALHLLRVGAAVDTGDGALAMKSIQIARSLMPQSPDSYVAEVPVLIRQRQLPEAQAAAEKALALGQTAAAWYQRGAVAHVRGDLAGATDAYGKALAADPNFSEARIARAGIAIDQRRDADAMTDIEALQRLSPREPRGAYLKAIVAERKGDAAGATAALRQVTNLLDAVPLEFIRYRPQLLMLGGLAHYGLQEREKAKPFLESFTRTQSPGTVGKLLAQIYLDEQQYDRAIVLLENELKATPNDAQAMTLLASALMSKGQHARAAELMQQALATNDAPELRTVLGLSLLRSGQANSALPQLEAALKKDPKQTAAAASLVGLYLSKGQNAKAVALATQLSTQQPDNAGFQNLLGLSRQRSGDAPGAQKAYEAAVKLDPRLTTAQVNLARLDAAAGRFDAASQRLAALIASDGSNVEALLEMAMLQRRNGKPADEQRWLERATAAADGRDVRPGLLLVSLQMQAGRPEQALETLKRLGAKAPQDLGVLLADARVRLAMKDPAAARNTLGTATRIANYDAPVQIEIANLQLLAGNPDGADYSVQKALQGQADYLPALALQAELFMRRGEPLKAEAVARQIVQLAPKRAIGYSLLGDAAMARQQPGAGLDAYRRAHQAEPSTETVLRLYTATAAQPDGQRASLQLLEQWVKTHPSDRFTVRMLADGHARAGRFAEARQAYESLLKQAPDDARVLNNLANVLLKLKDPAALATAEKALAAAPGDADVIDTAGWAAFKAGQTDRALQLLRDARLRAPDNPDIRLHLATVLAQAGRRSEAKAEIDAALQPGQAFDGLAEAQALERTLR